MEKELNQFREHCNKIYNERRNDVKFVLEKWLESFITKKRRPWRAIEGKKKLRPIPIHRNFGNEKKRNKEDLVPVSAFYFYWPDLPDEEIMNIIKDLGFNIYCRGETISLNNISLAIPAPKKGESLTFAQEWVKKINDSYSKYVAKEKLKAKEHYKNLLHDLSGYDTYDIRIDKEFMIFENYESEFAKAMSPKCKSELAKLLAKDGIYLHYNPSPSYLETSYLEAYVSLSLLSN